MRLITQYLAKIVSNLITLAATGTVLAVIPRALGPAEYGLYEYLTNFFVQLKTFFDLGTSSSFYTLLSQRNKEEGLIRFYRKYLIIISLALLVCGLILSYTPLEKFFSIVTESSLIIFAALYAIAILWLENIRKIIDAKNMTVRGEFYFGAVKIFSIIILLCLYYFSCLTISSYFIFQIIVVFITIISLTHLLRSKKTYEVGSAAEQSNRAYLREFWLLSHPLIVYTFVGASVGLVDRWILQKYAGTTQQGFFGLANQLAIVCFLLAGSMTQIFSRELSRAWHMQDIDRMRDLFGKTAPFLYTVTACFSIYVAYYSSELVAIIGGEDWRDGTVALAIMAIYPMHQTYGQLSGSIFFATGKTGLYRNISVIAMIAGIPVVVWFISPINVGGLEMGAIGLASKMVLMQMLFVNIGLWFNCKLLSIDFIKLIVHQIYVPLVLLLLIWTLDGVIHYFKFSILINIVCVGFIYIVLTSLLIFSLPKFSGLSNADLARLQLLFSKIKLGL